MLNVNGVLLLDKPLGITSNLAIQKVKRLFNTNSKVGHTGSLDPLATGMLPVCFGEATKFSGFLLNADKKYLVTMQLGIKTDTGDLDGQIIATDDNDFNGTKEQLLQILNQYIGDIWQTPPIYSAIKHNGVPLYKIARSAKKSAQNNTVNDKIKEDINIVVKPRQIKIYSLNLVDMCPIKKQISLAVHCSKGTYIRSLVEDLGKSLNCLATVANLRRIAIGNFLETSMVSISKLIDLSEQFKVMELLELLLPIDVCLSGLPMLEISQIDSISLQNGQKINIENRSDQFKEHTLIRLVAKDQLLGVGEIINNNQIIAKRLVRRGT